MPQSDDGPILLIHLIYSPFPRAPPLRRNVLGGCSRGVRIDDLMTVPSSSCLPFFLRITIHVHGHTQNAKLLSSWFQATNHLTLAVISMGGTVHQYTVVARF
jgi:hypothetical protein